MWIGLTVAFASALVTNTAYSLEHDAASALPPLSPRRPFRSAKFLLRDRRWLAAFGAETAGWLMYVAALQLAPLSLVQAVAASGVAVLAFVTARGHLSWLARREQAAVVLAMAGLVLLVLSLAGPGQPRPSRFPSPREHWRFANGPDPVPAAHQLGDDGGADGTGGADNDVNRAIWRGHHGSCVKDGVGDLEQGS